jgi:multisubunit Na+/H+ antiporter MnhB subunit
MTSVMTRSAARILLLPLWMVAFAILIKGYIDIGDGFSAGVIASLALIIQGIAYGADEYERLPLVRLAPLLTLAGLFLALLVAFVPVLFGDPVFLHRPEAGHSS